MAEDIDIERLVAELRRGPTDLARLVGYVLVRQPSTVWVAATAAEAWQQRDPDAWATVLAWLKRRAVSVKTI